VAELAAERLAFMVVHAGLSVAEYRGLTLREFVAIREQIESKGASQWPAI